MKKHSLSILALMVILLTCSYNTLFAISIYRASGYKPREETEGKFFDRYDEFQQITWIRHQFYDIEGATLFELYIGESKGNHWLRGVFDYAGSDWIFFDSAIIIDTKGNRISINTPTYDKKTKVLKGKVTETYDFLVSDSDAVKLRTILDDNTVRLRFSGDVTKDYNFKQERIVALREIINYYFELKE